MHRVSRLSSPGVHTGPGCWLVFAVRVERVWEATPMTMTKENISKWTKRVVRPKGALPPHSSECTECTIQVPKEHKFSSEHITDAEILHTCLECNYNIVVGRCGNLEPRPPGHSGSVTLIISMVLIPQMCLKGKQQLEGRESVTISSLKRMTRLTDHKWPKTDILP